MDKKILNTPLSCGIHTTSILTNTFVTNGMYKGVEQLRSHIDNTTGEIRYSLKINANTYNCEIEITSLERYKEVLAAIETEVGISDSILTRVDIKFDSFVDNYDRLFKLNKLLVLLIADTNHIKNRFHSVDPLKFNNLTVRVQNDYLEAENYNKVRQADFNGRAKNRLELRCKSLSKTKKDIEQCFHYWFDKLDKLVGRYAEFQLLCNSYLMRLWQDEKGIKVKGCYEFIRKYQDNVYSRRQLINLFEQLGAANSKSAADRFKQKNSIEYISEADLKRYINNIKQSAEMFLNSK